jgi:predicted transcriptional regulator of viral defense system
LNFCQKLLDFDIITPTEATVTISKTIRAHLEHRPFGELITATGLLALGLGTRTAIDQTLSRLCRQGLISRIARGVYAKPRDTRFGGRILPDANEIAMAFAKLRGQKLQIHGAEAVRRFGLTTQMPSTATYLTDGPDRTLHLGNLEVHLEHAPAKMFLLAGRLSSLPNWLSKPLDAWRNSGATV